MVSNRKSIPALATVAFVLALAGLLAPSDAAAQFPPVTNGNLDYCADEGPAGRGRGQDSRNSLTLAVTGAPFSSAYPRMWGTNASCITPQDGEASGAPCAGLSCAYVVQTVCEFHCYHDHTAPFHWTVGLVPQAAPPASYFQRWEAGCQPIKEAGRSICVVRMNTDQNAVAVFGPTPDTTPPAPFAAAATPSNYSIQLAWSASTDENLGGYEVFRDGALLARVPRSMNSTSFTVDNVFCESTYTLQVKAYDFSGNEYPSNTVSATTGACRAIIKPRPNTVIHVKPAKTTRAKTAFFHYGTKGELAATKYQCKLDRGAWTKCSGVSGKTYRRLKVGLHTFRVRAGNAAGYDLTPSTYTWRVRR